MKAVLQQCFPTSVTEILQWRYSVKTVEECSDTKDWWAIAE
jgi:hypothetical protein